MPSDPTATTSNHGERPLSLTEKYQLVKRLCDTYGNIFIAARVSIPFKGQLDTNSIKTCFAKSIEQVCQSNPILLAHVVDYDTETPRWEMLRNTQEQDFYTSLVKFERLENGNKDLFERIANRGDCYSEVFSNWLRDSFDITEKAPLWNLRVILGDAEESLEGGRVEAIVGFVTDHLITDGAGGSIVLKSVLENYSPDYNDGNIVRSKITSKESTSNVGMAIPPGIDDAIKDKPGVLRTLRVIPFGKMILPKSIQNVIEPSYWSGLDDPKREKHNSGCFVFTVSASRLAKLRKRASIKHGISVHAALWRIVAETIVICLAKKDPNYNHPTIIRSETPINARPLLRNPKFVTNQTVGNYTIGYERNDSISKNFTSLVDVNEFWKSAKTYKHELHKSMQGGMDKMLLLRYIGKFPEKWTEFFMKSLDPSSPKRLASFEISNLGKQSTKSTNSHDRSGKKSQSSDKIKSKIKIKQFFFAQSANIVGPVLSWNFVTTTSNPTMMKKPDAKSIPETHEDFLTCTITWQEGTAMDLRKVKLCYSVFAEILDHVINIGCSSRSEDASTSASTSPSTDTNNNVQKTE